LFGHDDLFNGIALSRFHHWAFDVGWFGLLANYNIRVSSKLSHLPSDFARIGHYELIRALAKSSTGICLPSRRKVYPHINSNRWHRQFVFHD
jgi:putative restriction endonuclease